MTITCLFAVLAGNMVYAMDNNNWEKPTFVYGGGLSEAEVLDTAKLLGITDQERVFSIDVNGDDLVKYIGGSGGTESMISSVLIDKDKNKGVEIEITTPKNITQITRHQYANASITAGIHDAHIKIGAIRPVTGESALTGIYKAYEANGEKLDTVRMKVAQDELETTNQIVQENKNKDGFNIEVFNQVIINVKQEINNFYNENNGPATTDQIVEIVNDTIEKHDLKNIISQDQKDQLVKLFNDYQNSGAVNSEEVLNQLRDLSKDVGNKVKDIYDDAVDSGLIDRIGQFFRDLWSQIQALFQ